MNPRKKNDNSDAANGTIGAMVFDVDGTLVDAFGDITAAVNHMLKHLSLPEQTREQVIGNVGYGVRVLVEKSLGPDLVETTEEGIRLVKTYYSSHCGEHVSLYTGAERILKLLSDKSIPIAALTNKPHDLTVKTLQHLGIMSMFSFVQGDEEGLPMKPHPESLLRVCRAIGIPLHLTVMVGDGDTDMQTAVRAGCRGWGVAASRFSEEDLLAFGATRTFPSLEHLADALELVLTD